MPHVWCEDKSGSSKAFRAHLALAPLACFALVLAACASHEFTDPSATIVVRSGGRFEVVIASNPTTGYRWELDGSSLGGVVRLEDKRYVADPNAFRAVGSGGRDVWAFVALAPGEATLRFEQFPPGTGAEAVATLEYRVIVE
jgi:predicted secreted protein